MASFIYCVLALFLGGALKGVVVLGLPLVGVPLLTFPFGLKGAVSVLVLPIIVSNLAQSFAAGLLLLTADSGTSRNVGVGPRPDFRRRAAYLP